MFSVESLKNLVHFYAFPHGKTSTKCETFFFFFLFVKVLTLHLFEKTIAQQDDFIERKFVLVFCVAHYCIVVRHIFLAKKKKKNELILLDGKNFDFL